MTKDDEIKERFFRHLFGMSEELNDDSTSSEEEANLFQKAAERVFLPARVKRIEQAIKQVKGRDAVRSTLLSSIVHVVKAERRRKNRILSAKLIAADVDIVLKKRNGDIRLVCPKGWLKTTSLPRTLSACLNHTDPKLRQKAKSLISRA